MTSHPLRCLLLTAASCLPVLAQQVTPDAKRLATACNQFAADLHGKLAAAGHPTCSPGSIATTLLMLLPAARGATATELAEVLHLPADLRDERMHSAATELLQQAGLMSTGSPRRDQPPALLSLSNDLWVQSGKPVAPAYVDLLRNSFGAAQWATDFEADAEAARTAINAHIAKATNQRIKELLAPGMILGSTRVVLTNALWFKARWEHPFWSKNTKEAPFTLASGTQVAVPMMYQAGFFAYTEDAAWQCLSMSFADSSIQCDILLPREGTPLAAAEAALLAGKYVATLRGERVQVRLPRFQVAATHRLAGALAALGLRRAFVTGDADFSGMGTGEPLVIDDIVHQTWIAVDEEGAEAAAATATVLKAGSAAPQGEPKVFTADRPFAFVLRDHRTGLVLFVGRVDNPSQQQG